jgi:hypothetical protein
MSSPADWFEVTEKEAAPDSTASLKDKIRSKKEKTAPECPKGGIVDGAICKTCPDKNAECPAEAA